MKSEPGSRYFHEPNGWLANPEIATQLFIGFELTDELRMLGKHSLYDMGRVPGFVEDREAPEVDVNNDISPTEDFRVQSPLLFIVIEDGRKCLECNRSCLRILLFLSQREHTNVVNCSEV